MYSDTIFLLKLPTFRRDLRYGGSINRRFTEMAPFT